MAINLTVNGKQQVVDVDSSMPLLWVIPLALYLLTFILVFASRPPVSGVMMRLLMPIVVTALALMMAIQATQPLLVLAARNFGQAMKTVGRCGVGGNIGQLKRVWLQHHAALKRLGGDHQRYGGSGHICGALRGSADIAARQTV